MAVRYNPKGYWEDVPAPTAPKFTPPPPAAPQYNPQAVGALNAPQYRPWQIAERITSAQNNVPQTLASQRLENFRATTPTFKPPAQPAPVSPFATPPTQAGMGELRRVEQAQTQAVNPLRTLDAQETQVTQRQQVNTFAQQYPNAANMNRPANLDPRNVGAATPPAVIGQHVDTEMWKNQGRRAWTTPGGAANVVGTPAYNERMAGEAWAKSGYDPKFQPKSMSPLLAEYLGIPEDERRKYYSGYATFDGKNYSWPFAGQAGTQQAGSGSGGYGSGYYGGWGGGGGGYSYAKQTPSWFERMLNWRI